MYLIPSVYQLLSCRYATTLLVVFFFAVFSAQQPALAQANEGLQSCTAPGKNVAAPPAHHMPDIDAMNALAPANRGVKATRSGRWSDKNTWGGKTPSGAILIPAGIGVIYDITSAANLTSVRIDGCLEFARKKNTRLKTSFLYVAPGGELWVGSPNAPIAASVKTEIIFPDKGAINAKADPRLLGKGLVSAARAEFHGAAKSTRHKTLSDPKKGDKTIKLAKQPQGWRVGDRLVLTGTRYVPFKHVKGKRTYQGSEDEELTVTAISGSTISVSPALKYNHSSPLEKLKPYLVNFTRNIRIETENAGRVPVTQRGHTMFMSRQTQVHNVELFELGRTDKSKRAHDFSDLAKTTSTSNLKGRYALHLHKIGFPSDDDAPVIQGVTAWGSPGWGFAHHTSKAFFYDSATYNVFGAGFVAESGDETGAWVGNTAIKAIGMNELVKDGASVKAFDLGRTGDGFWMQGRLIRIHRNVAAGLAQGTGFVYMTRGQEKPNQRVLGDDLAMPESLRFIPTKLWVPTIQQFTDNEVIAAEVGFQSLKANPRQPQDARSVNDGFTAWNVGRGIRIHYTAHYSVRDATLVGAPGVRKSVGFEIGNNTYDIVLASSLIKGFKIGADFGAKRNPKLSSESGYVIAGVQFSNISERQIINRKPGDEVIAGPNNRAVPSVNLKLSAKIPTWSHAKSQRNLVIKGTKFDQAGEIIHPVGTNENVVHQSEIGAIIDARGYYKLATGERAFIWPEYITDRISGGIDKISIPVKLGAKVNLRPSRRFTKTNPTFLGQLKPDAKKPTARNDNASVQTAQSTLINVLGNDTSNVGGALVARGHTHPRNGIVRIKGDGRISYRSFPGFKGTDVFYYWAEDKYGKPSRAKVTITVR